MKRGARVTTLPAGRPGEAAVLLLTELFPPFVGGSAMLFENVYSRLPLDDVTVLSDCGSVASGDERRNSLRILRRSIASSRWGVLRPWALAHHLRTARLVRSVAPGPVVLHCARALPEGLQAMLAAWSRATPYLCWAHGEELAYSRTSRELTALTRSVYRRAAAVLANSRHTARMVEALGIPSSKIWIVYPGVDVSRFRSSGREAGALKARLTPRGELLLLSVGRLQRRKGHDLVLAALRALRDHAPALRYAIVGDGDERPRLEQLVREYGLGDRVVFEGEVDAALLPQYYLASDIFVMPNRVDGVDVEGFGIVFLEAAAAARPAIGGRSGGVPEAIDEGRTGFLVGGTDPVELAGTISRLAQSEVLRRQIGTAGQTRVERDFTWDRAAAAVADIHWSVIGSR